MNKSDALVMLDEMQHQQKIGFGKMDRATAGFVAFYYQGGVHKASEKMTWAKVREMAQGKSVAADALNLLDIIMEGK